MKPTIAQKIINSMSSSSTSTSASTSALTKVRQELNRLSFVESGITEEEFGILLAYITKNPNKVPELEDSLKYGADNVKIIYLRNLLVSGIFHII